MPHACEDAGAARPTVPIAVHRKPTTTYGQLTAGDAAFADYTINLSVSMKL